MWILDNLFLKDVSVRGFLKILDEVAPLASRLFNRQAVMCVHYYPDRRSKLPLGIIFQI